MSNLEQPVSKKKKLDDTEMEDNEPPAVRSPNEKLFIRNSISELDKLKCFFNNDNDNKKVAVIMSASSGRIPTSSPVQIKKEIENKIKSNKKILELKVTKSSEIIFWSNSLECLSEILLLKKFLNTDIKVRVIEASITIKYLLKGISPEISLYDLGDELTNNNIKWSSICRFTRLSEGSKIPTFTILVTEIGAYMRHEMNLWYIRYETKKFEERPRLCFNCFYFGHPTARCANFQNCGNCADRHSTSSCKSEIKKCCRCKGPHSATDKSCPSYILEEKILKIKNENNISYFEARAKCQIKHKTYASVVANDSELQNSLKNSEIKELVELKNVISLLAERVVDIYSFINPNQLKISSASTCKEQKEYKENCKDLNEAGSSKHSLLMNHERINYNKSISSLSNDDLSSDHEMDMLINKISSVVSPKSRKKSKKKMKEKNDLTQEKMEC